MIMKNIVKIAIAAVICLYAAGCTSNFSEINRPYGAFDEDVLDRDNNRLGSQIPRMEMLIVPLSDNGAFQHSESLIGDVYGRMLMSNTGGTNAKWSGDFSWYTYDHAGWLNIPFNCAMGFYQPYVETWKATGADTENSIWALTRIMRVAVMHRLTEMYGPIPYTKIDPNDLDLYIPYDKEELVWTTMLSELSDAIDDLNRCRALGTTANIENFDRIYAGDFDKWAKYANSLLLRLAVRVSNVRPDLTATYAQKAISNGVIENNSDNAYMNMEIGRMNRIGSVFFTVVNTYCDSYAAADLICYLQGYNDPRLKIYFNTVERTNSEGEKEQVYHGLRAGSMTAQANLGQDPEYSLPTVKERDPYPLMTAAEVAFLRAECALNGWYAGNAQDFYEQGIRLSFEQWGASGVEGYITNSTSKPAAYKDHVNNEDADAPSSITIKWANDGKELQRIITQKYLALYPLGHEVWCDYRRTRFPEFMPVVSGKVSAAYSNMRVAERIMFAPDERNTNTDNFNEALTLLGGSDDFATKLWWAKK